MAKPKHQTDYPTSGVTAMRSTALPSLVEHAGQVTPDTDLEQAVGPLLDILADTEECGAAGIRLVTRGGDKIIERRSKRVVTMRSSGIPPRKPSRPPQVGKLFGDLPDEQAAQLPAPMVGSVHLAAPTFAQTPSERDALLRHAASLIGLTLRVATSGAPAGALSQEDKNITQLEKLATIGQTSSQIVHELNNPLTAIIAYSDYLTRRMRDREMPEGDVDRLLKINEAAVRIQRFCRQLTDYSRPAGSLRTPVDLREVLDSALSFCAHGLRGADITVERVYHEVPTVYGIDNALTQVFVNLITNAWHAMPNGGTLSLRVRSYDGEVIVEVADEGHGISDDDRHRIFDAYFSTKPKGTGVGLGLSIVKQIVNDHRGDVRAEPREPRGTVFVASFPPVDDD